MNKSSDPIAIRARNLADRKTTLGSKCEFCGSTEYLERHHPDYSKPLEVITVCKSCNAKIRWQDQEKPLREPCPYCKGTNIVKVGIVHKKRRLRCNDCDKSFYETQKVDNKKEVTVRNIRTSEESSQANTILSKKDIFNVEAN